MTAPAGTEGAPQGDPGAAANPPAEPNGTPPAEGAVDEKLGEPGLKALQVERDARAAAEARLKELETAAEDARRAKLSADQRLTLERDEAATRAKTAEERLARFEIARDKSIPASFVDRLVGTTPAELAADADRLLADLAALTGQPAPPPPPAGDKARELLPRGGGNPNDTPTETDPAKLAAMVPRF